MKMKQQINQFLNCSTHPPLPPPGHLEAYFVQAYFVQTFILGKFPPPPPPGTGYCVPR